MCRCVFVWLHFPNQFQALSGCQRGSLVAKGLSTATSQEKKPHPENWVGLMLGYIKLKDRSKDHGIKDSTDSAVVSWRLTESPKKLRIKGKKNHSTQAGAAGTTNMKQSPWGHTREKRLFVLCNKDFEIFYIKAEADCNCNKNFKTWQIMTDSIIRDFSEYSSLDNW